MAGCSFVYASKGRQRSQFVFSDGEKTQAVQELVAKGLEQENEQVKQVVHR